MSESKTKVTKHRQTQHKHKNRNHTHYILAAIQALNLPCVRGLPAAEIDKHIATSLGHRHNTSLSARPRLIKIEPPNDTEPEPKIRPMLHDPCSIEQGQEQAMGATGAAASDDQANIEQAASAAASDSTEQGQEKKQEQDEQNDD